MGVPDRPTALLLSRRSLAAAASLAVFIALAAEVAVSGPGGLPWETGLAHFLVSRWRTDPLLGAMWLSRHAAGWEALLVASAAVACVLALRRPRELLFLAASMAVVPATLPLKAAFDRPPPEVELGGYAFPSGHAAGTVALVAVVVTLLAGTRWQRPAVLVGAAFALTVGAAVVTSQGHWPSDVLAGWALALAWVACVRETSVRWASSSHSWAWPRSSSSRPAPTPRS